MGYQTYIYAQVEREHFKKATSYIYSATFLGTFASALLSQLLLSFNLLNIRELNFISLGGVSVALVSTFFLPRVPKNVSAGPGLPLLPKLQLIISTLWRDFKAAYSNPYVLKWSIWWGIEKAGNFQVVTYHKSLLEDIDPGADENEVFNGALQAVQCVLSKIYLSYYSRFKSMIERCPSVSLVLIFVRLPHFNKVYFILLRCFFVNWPGSSDNSMEEVGRAICDYGLPSPGPRTLLPRSNDKRLPGLCSYHCLQNPSSSHVHSFKVSRSGFIIFYIYTTYCICSRVVPIPVNLKYFTLPLP